MKRQNIHLLPRIIFKDPSDPFHHGALGCLGIILCKFHPYQRHNLPGIV